jgi:hypothetical protein
MMQLHLNRGQATILESFVGGWNTMSEGIFKGEKCEFCGKQAENFLFAAFLCESEECIEKARKARGGPGGHRFKKQESEK